MTDTTIQDDSRWKQVIARDKSADGSFYYSVKTTGVYCRPSCGARLAKPENVEFYATQEEAQRAGFRPCRRCKPDAAPRAEQHAQAIASACRRIDDSEKIP